MVTMSTFRNIIAGAGSILEIFPAESRRGRPEPFARCDLDAMRADWEAVGGDFRRAIKSFRDEREHGEAEQAESRTTSDV